MEEYKNDLLDNLVGKKVTIMRLVGPVLDNDLVEKILANPLTVRDQLLHSRTMVCTLRSYDHIGVVVGTVEEEPTWSFVPWGAVIELVSLDPDEL